MFLVPLESPRRDCVLCTRYFEFFESKQKKSFLYTRITKNLDKSKPSQNDSCGAESVTWVQLSVTTSQQVAELLAAFTLAVASRGVEA